MASVPLMKMMTSDEIRKKYEKLARWYDAQDTLYEMLCVKRMRAEIIRKSVGDVLEVAVGTGKNLQFYPPDSKIVAIDFSPAMMDQARKRAKQLNRSIDFQIMDAEQLAFPDESFDTVVSTLTGCTFPHPETVYREMVRVCRQNGKILLIEHGRSSAAWLGWVQDRLAKMYYQHYACLWNRNPLASLRSAGLAISVSRQAFLGVFHAIEIQKSKTASGDSN